MALLSSPSLDCHTFLSMDTLISSVFTPRCNSSSGCPSELSFSHAISSAPLWAFQKTLKTRRVISSVNIYAVASSSPRDTDVPRRSPHRLLKELEEMKNQEKSSRKVKDKLPPKTSILKTPMDDQKLARRFLKSPQLSLKSFPLLSSCLPASPLGDIDKAWMEDNLLEAKQALGYPLETLSSFDEDSPAAHFDTLLYLAFQHEESERAKNSRYVRIGHSRLSFLGQYVQSLALAELFLQRYPREGPACLRERAFGMTNKRVLPYWIKVASLDNLIFPCDDITKMRRQEREPAIKQVFQALMGAIYLCFGMAEIYRVLFEAFGMDPDAEDCQPKERRQLEDIDYVSSEYEGKQLTWQEMVAYKRPVDALFAHPRLFRACVPPGMHKFRGNIWEVNDLPHVLQVLGYPLPMSDTIPQATEARNIELGLGLQLCFLHPSKYKFEHPRFCFERLEYLGQNIQDIVMAERLLMKHLDAPAEPPSQEEIQELLKYNVLGESDDTEDSEEENEDMVTETDKNTDAVAKALAAADALGNQSADFQRQPKVDDIANGLKELDMDHYDDEDEGIDIFGSGSLGSCYYPTNDMDPYLVEQDDDDEDEIEDMRIKPSDLIILCARNEDDVSHLEVWIYEEETEEGGSNMYVHHDIILPAFPLSLAWLDCNLKGGDKGNFVAVGTMQPEIELWDLDLLDEVEPAVVLGGAVKDEASGKATKLKKKKKNKQAVTFKEGSHTDAVLGLAWNMEYRNVLASASADKSVKIWDIVAEKCEHTMHPHTDKVQAVAWNPNQATVLLSGSFDRSVIMMDMRAPTHSGIRWPVPADVESLAWDPHTDHLFMVSAEDGTVRGFDIRAAASTADFDGKPMFTLHAHDKAVCTISYNPAAPNLLATGSTDKMVKLWDITNNQPSCIASTNPNVGAVFSAAFSKNSPFLLATGGSKGILHVWDTLDNSEVVRRFGKFRPQN